MRARDLHCGILALLLVLRVWFRSRHLQSWIALYKEVLEPGLAEENIGIINEIFYEPIDSSL